METKNTKINNKNISSSISIRKYKTSLIKPFYQSLEDVIGLRNCQTYYPIMNKYIFIDNYQKNLKNYLFETKYQCIKIFNKETIDEVDVANCIQTNCTLKKNKNKKSEYSEYNDKTVIKISPLIDPIKLIINSYSNLAKSVIKNNNKIDIDESSNIDDIDDIKDMNDIDLNSDLKPINFYQNDNTDSEIKSPSTWLLPNLYNVKTINKINSYYNTTYIETFAMYLLNRLVECGRCPTFPYFYGSVNGIKDEYFQDISEEYHELSSDKRFLEQKDKTFNIITMDDDIDDIDDDIKSSLNKVNNKNNSLSNFIGLNNDNNDNNNVLDKHNKPSTFITKKLSDSESSLYLSDIEENEKVNKLKKSKNIKSDSSDSSDLGDSCDSSDWETNSEISDTTEKSNNSESKQVKRCLGKNSYKNGCNTLSSDNSYQGNGKNYFVRMEKFPVQVSMMEKLELTLDELLDSDYNMSETEWASILFQVSFGLAVAQKEFKFTHNDIHSDNIMFRSTKENYLYYQIGNSIYKIPTYNRITKIIDFARGTFNIDGKWYLSDVFNKDGDAEGQYDYNLNKFKSNYSFDLARLGTTIIERLDDKPIIKNLVNKWMKTKSGGTVANELNEFDVYVKIAKECYNAIPIKVLEDKVFNQFKISKKYKPSDKYIYYY